MFARENQKAQNADRTAREINDVAVRCLKRKLQTDESIDVAETAHEMARSFVDMVTEQDEFAAILCHSADDNPGARAR
jgi:hypothetical protein